MPGKRPKTRLGLRAKSRCWQNKASVSETLMCAWKGPRNATAIWARLDKTRKVIESQEDVPVSVRISAFALRHDSGREPHAGLSSAVRRQRHFQKLSLPFSHVEASLLARFTRKVFPDDPGHMQRSSLKQLPLDGPRNGPSQSKGSVKRTLKASSP